MNEMQSFLERNWWLLAIRGVAAILFGIAAFAWPGLTVALLVLMFGAYVLIDGIAGIIDSIRYRDRLKHWWLWLLDGAISAAVGALILLMPGVTAYVLLILIATWAIVGGVLRIIAALQLREQVRGEWLLGLGGVLSVLFGIVLIMAPAAGVLSMIWLIALWAVVFGVLFVMLALRLRSAGQSR